VVAYGVPRLSADVDVTLRLTPDSPERFVDDMRVTSSSLGRVYWTSRDCACRRSIPKT
jgi:hypothetical protein